MTRVWLPSIATLRFLIVPVFLLALFVACGGGTDSASGPASGEGSFFTRGDTSAPTAGGGSETRSSDSDEAAPGASGTGVSQPQGDSTTGGPDSAPSASGTGEPRASDPSKPHGYYLGSDHGLALAQTTRRASTVREGWVDITLDLAAIQFGGGTLQLTQEEGSNTLCLGGVATDCFHVKWGSTEQNEGELSRTLITDTYTYLSDRAVRRGSGSDKPIPSGKMVNLQATFPVAPNATNASLYFGEHKIPLDLQGYSPARGAFAGPVPVPAPPSSQDAALPGFFMDAEHGIAVTGVYRSFPSQTPSVAHARIELLVASSGDYESSVPEETPEPDTGSVCLAQGETRCLDVLWGAEGQFDALVNQARDGTSILRTGGSTRLVSANRRTLAEARQGGPQWPMPLVVEFTLPANQHSAVLKFGEHRIPLELRGMAGGHQFDYTAFLPEASPGSLLYESAGKTVTLDSITHDPETGDMKLAMTASNGSEASDFTPVFSPEAYFSQAGTVDIFGGSAQSRLAQGERLVPGQSTPWEVVVPRVGDGDSWHVAYSPDPARRPDGVVLTVTDANATAEDKPQGYLPRFARFDRSGDEEKFWPAKILWTVDFGSPSASSIVDGVAYLDGYQSAAAVNAATGENLWAWEYVGGINAVEDGIAYVDFFGEALSVGAMDAATGELLWQPPQSHGFISVEDGVLVAGRLSDLSPVTRRYQRFGRLRAYDAATGDLLWSEETLSGDLNHLVQRDGAVYHMAEDHKIGALDEITARNANTGELLWSFGDADVNRFTVRDEVVYLIESSGGGPINPLTAIDAATGTQLWQHENRFDGRSITTVGGAVYVHGENNRANFYSQALWDARTGAALLEPELVGSIAGMASDGVLYRYVEGGISAVQVPTMEELWLAEPPGSIYPFRVVDGVLYGFWWWEGNVVRLSALDASTGATLWSIPPLDSDDRWPFDDRWHFNDPPLIEDGVVIGYRDRALLYALAVNK